MFLYRYSFLFANVSLVCETSRKLDEILSIELSFHIFLLSLYFTTEFLSLTLSLSLSLSFSHTLSLFLFLSPSSCKMIRDIRRIAARSFYSSHREKYSEACRRYIEVGTRRKICRSSFEKKHRFSSFYYVDSLFSFFFNFYFYCTFTREPNDDRRRIECNDREVGTLLFNYRDTTSRFLLSVRYYKNIRMRYKQIDRHSTKNKRSCERGRYI